MPPVLCLAERLVLPGSPFELISAGPDANPVRLFRHAPPSLNSVYRRMTTSATHPCMVFGNQRISFGDLVKESSAVAHALRRRGGVSARQRIAIVLPNGPTWLAAFVAITSMGCVATLIDPRAGAEQIVAALSAADCTAIVADSVTAQLIRDSGVQLPLVIAECTRPAFEAMGTSVEASCFDTPIDPEQEALISFTSGSTGTPKGVISTHRAVITGMMNMMLGGALAASREKVRPAQPARPQRSPSSLLLAPFTHVAGYSHLLLMMWVTGKVSALPSWQVDDALALIEREKLRTISGASHDMLMELSSASPGRYDVSSISAVGVHGAQLRPALLRAIEEHLPNAVPLTGYGMTETNGSVCVAASSEIADSHCGPFVPSAQVRILDEAGCEVAHGVTGEIWIRGAMLMSGYCPTPRNAPVLQDGWYRTEDFGRVDAAGNLFLGERRQDVVCVRGRQISCATVERLACDSGAFDDAAAFVLGEGERSRLVVAVVARNPQSGGETLIAERLAREDALRGCEVDVLNVERLPRTRSGKVDRQALRRSLKV